MAEAIFGEEGEEAAAAVLSDFTRDYGREMADALMKYRNENFNAAD